MNNSFSLWAMNQLNNNVICRVENSMTCIPLKNDPICMSCFDSDLETEDAKPSNKAIDRAKEII